MEVSILSRGSVKPSTLHTQLLADPIKLNLLDQLTPMHYSPLILFYPNTNNNLKNNAKTSRLKWSLSETLSLYYPLAGRVRDNFAIHDFHKGVPFVESRVECTLQDFLGGGADPPPESLNCFLPMPTFCHLPDAGPQVAVQLNEFSCGGLALGMCFSHKTHDGNAVSSFLRTWAAINANDSEGVLSPDLSQGPATFPPASSMPGDYPALTQRLWFSSEGRPATRRFVFGGESVAELRAKARSPTVENPTRAEALLSFIWKGIVSASASSGSKSTLFTQSVDLRRLVRPRLSRHSFGNLILFSDSKYDLESEESPRLDELARLVRSGVREINVDYVKRLAGEDGSEAIFEYYERQAEIEDGEDNAGTNVLNFSCWHGFGFSKTDFGWGPAVWVGLSGAEEAERRDGGGGNTLPYCSNSVVLMENGRNKDVMEAWVTLEKPIMDALENEREFLQFADRKFSILSPN